MVMLQNLVDILLYMLYYMYNTYNDGGDDRSVSENRF